MSIDPFPLQNGLLGNQQALSAGVMSKQAIASPGDDIVRAIKALNEALERGAQAGWSVILEVDVDLGYGPGMPAYSQIHATVTGKV